ncbi:MAG: hypothetical protein HRT38_19575, partial [Alteromonadaceae bacterium]|nr:hypothetical protein [Alteromonadaceae bacterium]
MQNFITWIGNLTFSDWTGFLSLIVAVIVGFFIKNTIVKHIKKIKNNRLISAANLTAEIAESYLIEFNYQAAA